MLTPMATRVDIAARQAGDGSLIEVTLLGGHADNLTQFGHMKQRDQPQSRPTHAAVGCLFGRDGSTVDSKSEADNEGIATMLGAGRKGGLRRGVADFVLALILFWAIALSFDAGHSSAYAVSLPALAKEAIQPAPSLSSPATLRAERPLQPAQFVHRVQTSPELSRLLLSLAFAGLAAINLGFWRHLRRVYASPRRRVWRRG
jgi:hypothetical protein